MYYINQQFSFGKDKSKEQSVTKVQSVPSSHKIAKLSFKGSCCTFTRVGCMLDHGASSPLLVLRHHVVGAEVPFLVQNLASRSVLKSFFSLNI